MPPKDPETEALKVELQDKIKKLQESAEAQKDQSFDDLVSSASGAPAFKAQIRKACKGHLNKTNCVHFAADSRHLVSGSLDGKLIIWDIYTGNKTSIIPLRSAWVMSCCFSPSGNFVASGGMDNQCTIHDCNARDATGAAKISRELIGYEGFLSSMRFQDDNNIITGSGDSLVIHWDATTGKKINQYFGHSGDVATLSLAEDHNTLLTGSNDMTTKLWDLRSDKCQQTFWGHKADVNCVYYHPSGFAFGTGSEDKTARLWDIRSDQQVAQYDPPNGKSGFTSCVLSKSGRYIICGADDNGIHAWDTLKKDHKGTLEGHDNRITSLAMSPSGIAMASCSWDSKVLVWGL